MPVAFVPKTLDVHVWIFYSLLRGSPCSITDGWRTYIYGSPYTRIHSTLSPPPPPPRTVYLAGFSSSRLRSAYSPLLKPRYMNMLSKSCSFLIYRFIVPRATPPRPRPPLSFRLVFNLRESSSPPVYAVSLYKFRYLSRRTNCSRLIYRLDISVYGEVSLDIAARTSAIIVRLETRFFARTRLR